MVDGLFFGHFFWKVEGSCAHTRESRVAHVHGNALMCTIPSMVEGSPSHTAHVWLMCTVMPSRVAFPQWWRGAPHVWLRCTVMPSHVAFTQWWRGAPHIQLTCTVMPSHVAFPQWWRGAPHVQLTCGSHAR